MASGLRLQFGRRQPQRLHDAIVERALRQVAYGLGGEGETQLYLRPGDAVLVKPDGSDLTGTVLGVRRTATGRRVHVKLAPTDTAIEVEAAASRAVEVGETVGVRVLKDGSKAFVALGPANHVAVIDAKTFEVEDYLLVGQRVWQLAFTPDEKLLFTTNGNSNDISVIDVPSLKVIKSMPVGTAPWGVTVSEK